MKKPALFSATLLLLLGVFWMSAASSNQTPFSVRVSAHNSNKLYKTHAAVKGSLFGGLVRLNNTNQGFKNPSDIINDSSHPGFDLFDLLPSGRRYSFTYTPNDDYGPFLQSVNGLAGDSSHYWALLSGKTMLTVGMGCYFPKANEVITLNYTKF